MIYMFIVNTDTSSSLTFSYVFSSQMDILIYIYLSALLLSTIIESYRLSKIKVDSSNDEITKYFLWFNFVKFISLFLFVGYIILLTL